MDEQTEKKGSIICPRSQRDKDGGKAEIPRQASGLGPRAFATGHGRPATGQAARGGCHAETAAGTAGLSDPSTVGAQGPRREAGLPNRQQAGFVTCSLM